MSRLFSRLPRPRTLALATAGGLTSITAYSVLTSGPADDILPRDPASLYYGARDLRLEGRAPVGLDRPSANWTPPSREEQLIALGAKPKSSAQAATAIASSLAGAVGLGGKKSASVDDQVAPAQKVEEFDLLVVGGGATGAGVALDAASRGLKVAVVERDDFSSGERVGRTLIERSQSLTYCPLGERRYLVQVDEASPRRSALLAEGRFRARLRAVQARP